MKEVIQRVSHASVKVGGKTVGSCKNGFLILLGVMAGDEKKEADKLVKRPFTCASLRMKTAK